MESLPSSLGDLAPSLKEFLNSNDNDHTPTLSDSLSLRSGERAGDRGNGGPTSSDGKAVSRLNSFTHGLDATDEIFRSSLNARERSAYRKIRRSLNKFYSPETSYETLIVDRMAVQHLRMLRLYRLESDAMDLIPNPRDKSSIIPHLDRFSRYDVRIEKQLRILHNRLIFIKEISEKNCFKLFPTKE